MPDELADGNEFDDHMYNGWFSHRTAKQWRALRANLRREYIQCLGDLANEIVRDLGEVSNNKGRMSWATQELLDDLSQLLVDIDGDKDAARRSGATLDRVRRKKNGTV